MRSLKILLFFCFVLFPVVSLFYWECQSFSFFLSYATFTPHRTGITLPRGVKLNTGLFTPCIYHVLDVLEPENGGFLAKYRGDPLRTSKLTPRKPPCGHHVYGRHGQGSPVKNRWRFSKFWKKYETLTITLKICILQENESKELTLVLFESLF